MLVRRVHHINELVFRCFILFRHIKEFVCFITQPATGVQALCEHLHTRCAIKLGWVSGVFQLNHTGAEVFSIKMYCDPRQMNREMLSAQVKSAVSLVKTVGVGVDRQVSCVVFMCDVRCSSSSSGEFQACQA